MLDTCRVGRAGRRLQEIARSAPSSEAAIGRLHEATGRPVLTAAAAGKPAFEGYKGHGVFTYALMEALHKGDTNNNGKIELTELVAHVQKRVPELVTELDEHGGVVKGAAVIAMRGAEGARQSAQFGSTGEDFTIAARLPSGHLAHGRGGLDVAGYINSQKRPEMANLDKDYGSTYGDASGRDDKRLWALLLLVVEKFVICHRNF